MPVQTHEATCRRHPMSFRAFPSADSGRNPSPGTVHDCLIVDDDPVSRRAIARQLTCLGVQVREVGAAEAAFGIWQQWRPAAVLIDCVLPGWDGYRLAGFIREYESRLPDDPRSLLIAVSGRSDPAHWHRCEVSGMDGALAKPARMTDFMQSLGIGATARASHNASARSQELELRCLYASSCGVDLQNLFSALSAGQDEQVRHHAHRIEGASLVVKATEVAATARQLGDAVRAGLGEVELALRAAALDQACSRWLRQQGRLMATSGQDGR